MRATLLRCRIARGSARCVGMVTRATLPVTAFYPVDYGLLLIGLILFCYDFAVVCARTPHDVWCAHVGYTRCCSALTFDFTVTFTLLDAVVYVWCTVVTRYVRLRLHTQLLRLPVALRLRD